MRQIKVGDQTLEVTSIYRVNNGNGRFARNGLAASLRLGGSVMYVTSLTGEGETWYIDAIFHGLEPEVNKGFGYRGPEIDALDTDVGRQLYEIATQEDLKTYGVP